MSCASQARFWILRQKYVEALEREDVQQALHTLRLELAPLQVNAPEVRMLAGERARGFQCHRHPVHVGSVQLAFMLVAPSPLPDSKASRQAERCAHAVAGLLLQSPDSKQQASTDWSPAPPVTRSMLVNSLQRLLPPTLMVPDGRLEQLLEQALDAQVRAATGPAS